MAIRDRLLSCCLEGWREDAGETEHSEQESWKPRSTNLSESRRGTQPIESLYTLKCESASMGFSTRRRGHLRDCENFAKVGLQLYSEQCPHESVLCSEWGGPGWWRVAAVPVAVRRGTRHLCRLKYTEQSKHRNNHSAKCFLHLTWIIDCTDCTAQCHQDQPVDISRPAVGSRSGCPVASIVYIIHDKIYTSIHHFTTNAGITTLLYPFI